MRRAALVLSVLFAAALPAQADDFEARAQLGFQLFDLSGTTRQGFRQTYDVGLNRAITETSRLDLFFRAEDFRGTTETALSQLAEKSGVRQYQPVGEFVINAERLRMVVRSDFLRDQTFTGTRESNRDTERTSALLSWEPLSLPMVQLVAHRNRMTEDRRGAYGDETVLASVQYPWRGLTVSAQGRHLRSSDDDAGYERTQNTLTGQVGYARSAFGGRATFSADALAERSDIRERVTSSGSAFVPVPVRSRAAYHVVDDTPLDNRDRPLVAVPALRDSNLNGLTSIGLGPESAAFQNLALDFGRAERVDEIRVVMRDEEGNPLRNGGGPVEWDVYVSDDGVTWAPVGSATSRFDGALSTFVVSFEEATTRWVKVVSFGLHFERVYATELQAFNVTFFKDATGRDGTQDVKSGFVSLSVVPVRRLTVSYSGAYSEHEQRFAAFGSENNTTLDHNLAAELQLLRSLRLRGSAVRTEVSGYGQSADGSENLIAAIEYSPTARLRLTLEASRQTQTILGAASTIDTQALRLYGLPVRAVTLSIDAGVQSQTIPGSPITGKRTFVNLSTSARLTRTTRLLLTANVQRARGGEDDPASLLLGAARDDRYSAELTWQPGRPLLVSTRLGWNANPLRRGLTQRYRAEWNPFAGGAVSLIASYDDELDPLNDRRSRRLVFGPRWTMSRYLSMDVHYTAVETEIDDRSDQQKTFYATLTVTK